MPTHSTDDYKDGHKWIIFCVKCGKEEPFESKECSKQYVKGVSVEDFKKINKTGLQKWLDNIDKNI